MKKLNLGCGKDVRKGWVNVDVCFLEGVDQVVNLNHYPWPFNTEEFDSILCKSIIEHLEDFPRAMRELHRVTKKGGTIEITVLHYTSTDAYGDPTHQKIFSSLTFLFFKKKHNCEYYFDFSFDDVKVKIKFLKKPVFFYNPLLELLVNIDDNTRLYYARLLYFLGPQMVSSEYPMKMDQLKNFDYFVYPLAFRIYNLAPKEMRFQQIYRMRNILLTSLNQEEISFIKSFIKKPTVKLVLRGSVTVPTRSSGTDGSEGSKKGG